MSFLNPIEELVNYIISHIHESLLLNRLDNQKLKANISEGVYILQDIQFNSKSINENLPNSTLHITSAKASRMNLQVPSLLKIFESPVKIRLTDLEINLCSAKSSGYSVSIPNVEPLTESDENPGLNVLTKSIGKLLSSINVEICLMTLNILYEKDSFSISIPKVSYTENLGIKSFRIEGVYVCVNNNYHDKICVIEDNIEGNVSISTKGFEIESVIEKFLVYLDYSQIGIITRIFTSLGVSNLLSNSSNELISALKQIEKKIDLNLPLKTNKINLRIKGIEVFVINSSKNTEKLWEYDEKVHEQLNQSHFHVKFGAISLSSNIKNIFSINEFKIDYYHFISKDLNDSNFIFQSANDSYFPEFFKLPESVNENFDQFCIKNVIFFEKRVNENIFQAGNQDFITEAFLSPINLCLNIPIFKEIYKIYKIFQNFSCENREKIEKKNEIAVNLNCRQIIVKIYDENEENMCEKNAYHLKLVIGDFLLNLEEKIGLSFTRILFSSVSDFEEFKMFELNKIILEVFEKRNCDIEGKKEKNYSSYFDSNQGFIIIGKNKSTQSASIDYSSANYPATNKNEIINEGSPLIISKFFNLSVTSLNFWLSFSVYKHMNQLLKKFSDVFPKEIENNEDNMNQNYRLFIRVKQSQIEMESNNFNIYEIIVKGDSQQLTCECSDFCIESSEYKSYNLGTESLQFKFFKAQTQVIIKNILLNYVNLLDIFKIFQGFTETNEKESETLKKISVIVEDCIFLIPTSTLNLSFYISDSEFKLLSGYNLAFDLSIGQLQLLTSKELPIQYTKSEWLDFFSNSCNVFTNISCVNIKYSFGMGFRSSTCLYGKNCSYVVDDFYSCSNQGEKQDTIFIEINIGTLIFHACKDTFSNVFDTFFLIFPEKNSEKPDALGNSIYYDINPNLSENSKTIHFHSKISEKNTKSPNMALNLSTFILNLYSGYENPSSLQSKRSIFNRIMFRLESFQVNYYQLSDSCWEISSFLENFELLNYLKSSPIKKIICKDIKSLHCSEILKFSLLGNLSEEIFSNIDLSFSPLKLNIDQCFLDFIFEWSKEEATESTVILPSKPENNSIKIENISINPSSISVDYFSNRSSIVSILKIEDFLIRLPKFSGKNFKNIDEAVSETWIFWLEYLQRNKYVLLSTLSPIVSLTNIGTALVGLFTKPFDSENAVEGTKQGILGLIKVFSIEGLKVFDTFFALINKIIGFSKIFGINNNGEKISQKIGMVFQYLQHDKKQIMADMNKFKNSKFDV